MGLVCNSASSCPQIHGEAVYPTYRIQEMAVEIESLFTSALGLAAPWRVANVELKTGQKRIDFKLTCDAKYFDLYD